MAYTRAKVVEEISASADRVFGELGAFNNLTGDHGWHNHAEHAQQEGHGANAQGQGREGQRSTKRC